MPNLTDTYVKKLPAAESGTKKFWDGEIKGLVQRLGETTIADVHPSSCNYCGS
ncbi:hypothetical protein Z945_2774 [Sulfitobacter noctilucae]|uniref:hypothetical protein n=1 Tax=Sulfitobacter noctilucae TaxID=1342302 RepID=UPI000A5155A1|nr:hypothetical protein [Sulfitobacter noctilucae]KIN61780.1 hypothetical protein Z945_2774 [Sulfitobacter noctilucae]